MKNYSQFNNNNKYNSETTSFNDKPFLVEWKGKEENDEKHGNKTKIKNSNIQDVTTQRCENGIK